MPYVSFSRHLLRFLIIVTCGLIGVVLAEASAPAQETQPSSPQSCATCHVDVVNAWQSGLHAQAFSDPIFQDTWAAQGNDPECLACHTTGFEARTGNYTHEGVTCEACHGLAPEGHPPEPIAADPGVDVCADCHTTTFTEWEQSAHGSQQLACTTCHQPHPQTLRFESANALCLDCHNEEARDDYAHLVHADQACVNCHWFRADLADLQAHYTSGNLFPTGHTGVVETEACISCHQEISASGILEAEKEAITELNPVSQHPLLEAQVRIEELEAKVDTVKAQGENTSSLRLVQGLIIGVAAGGLGVFGVARFRSRTTRSVEEHKEEE
jgi:predicted CXXCH cytochrome family protein